jgi:hypothetical protein
VKAFHTSQDEEQHGRNGEDQEEGIVAFQHIVMILAVVIAMQLPKKSVHHVLMGGPGNKLHRTKSGEHYKNDMAGGHHTNNKADASKFGDRSCFDASLCNAEGFGDAKHRKPLRDTW